MVLDKKNRPEKFDLIIQSCNTCYLIESRVNSKLTHKSLFLSEAHDDSCVNTVCDSYRIKYDFFIGS